MNLPTSALVVLLLMTTLSATALSEDIPLTCPDTAQRKLKTISKTLNCIHSFVPEEEVAICRGFVRTDQVTFVNLTFKMLEEVPEGTAVCLGLLNVSFIVQQEEETMMKYSVDFNPLLAVGVLTGDHNTSNTNRSCSISLLKDVLDLSVLQLWYTNYWDFSSSLLGTKLNWMQSFTLHGLFRALNLTWLEKLQNTSIQSLELIETTASDTQVALVTGMPFLRKLVFDDVNVHAFHPDSFLGMPEMEVLILKDTGLGGIPQLIVRMPKLKILEVVKAGYTFKFKIPKKELSTLTNLQALNLGTNNLFSISGKLPPLPKLRILNLDDCRLFNVKTDDFIGFPMLEELILTNNRLTHIEPNTFLALDKLKILDLTKNNITTWPVLYGRSLIFLNVSQNRLTYLYNFGNTGTTVDVLNISFNRISEWEDKYVFLSQKIMIETNPPLRNLGTSGLTYLLSWVIGNESRKQITAKQFEDAHEYSYSMLPHFWVKKIDISNNLISGLSERMVQSLDGIDEIDLGGNEFDCVDCRMIPFQKWLTTTSIIVNNFGTSDPLPCSSPGRLRGTPVNLVQFDEKPCLEKIRTTSLLTLIGVPVGAMTTLVVAAAGVIYKYRAAIAYILRLYKIRQRTQAFSRDVSNEHAFDAFICYSSQDRRFVLTRLAPLLEKGEEKYRLCLHERDFPLGSHIVSNIVGSIQHSRKTIVVLSKYFISSKWSNWELEMANHKMFNEDEHFLILIQLETVDRDKLPRQLQFLMDTRTYLRWPSSSGKNDEEKLLVTRLKEALGPSIFQKTKDTVDQAIPGTSRIPLGTIKHKLEHNNPCIV